MKDDSNIQSTALAIHSSLDSRNNDKYDGLIEKSFFASMKDDLVKLFSYIHSVSSPLIGVSSYITVLSVLQFIGPSLCLQYRELFDPDGIERPTITILSFIIHLIPVRFRESYVNLFSYSFVLLYIVLTISLFYMSQIYKKTSSVPIAFGNIMNVFFLTFAGVLPPIIIQLTFENLSRALFTSSPNAKSIYILSSITILVTLAFLMLFLIISSDGLVFQPKAMMSLMTKTQNRIYIATNLLTIFFGFATYSPWKMKVVCALIGFVIYIISLTFPYKNGGFIHNNMKLVFLTSSFVGAFCSLGVVFMMVNNYRARLIHLFLVLILFFIILSIIRYVIYNQTIKYLKILDDIEEIEDFKELPFTSVDHLLNVAICGYHLAHPSCLNWMVFKLGIDKWQKSVELWYAFAKFVVIYPEETQLLGWIFKSVLNLKLKGSIAKEIKMGLKMMTRERELNMCPILKVKLNNIVKDIQSTKHKLRRVWDVVIQGNLGEIEQTTKRVSNSMIKNDSDFKELLFEFPNNRFVTRAYSRFLFEIVGDIQRGLDMNEKTKRLSRGLLVTEDKAHELGLMAFPNLPSRIVNQNKVDSIYKGINTENFQTSLMEADIDSGHDIEKKDITILKDRIDEITFPSIFNTIFIRFFVFLVMFLLLFMTLGYAITLFKTDLISPLDYIFDLAQLRQFLSMATAFGEKFVLQNLDIIQPSIPMTSNLPSSLGNSWNQNKQIKFLLKSIASTLQKIEGIRSYKADNNYINEVREDIFSPIVEYCILSSFQNVSYRNYSIQNAIGDYIIQLEKISQLDGAAIDLSILDSTILLNPIKNLDSMTSHIDKALYHFKAYIESQDEYYNKLFVYSLLGISLFMLIGMIFMLYRSQNRINENKLEVYRCLTSLPKNTVSSIAENLRVIKKDVDGSSTSKDSELSKQEENTLKIFNSASSGEKGSSEIIQVSIMTLFMVILHIISMYLVFSLCSYELQRLDENVPHIHYLHNSFSSMFSAVSMMNHFVSMFTPNHILLYNIEELKYIINQRMENAISNLHLSWFGGRGNEELPFFEFDNILTEGNKASLCRGRSASTGIYIEELICRPIDTVFNLVQPYIQRLLNLHTMMNDTVEYEDNTTRIFWDLLLYPIFDKFFSPMAEEIIPSILNELEDEETIIMPFFYSILVLSTLCEIFITLSILRIDSHLRFVLGLLQHCPTSIVLQTPKIVSILSGNISSIKSGSAKRDEEFFDSVFNCLPDPILSSSLIGDIEIINESFKQRFSGLLSQASKLETFLGLFRGDKATILALQNNTVSELQMDIQSDNLTFRVTGFLCGNKYVVSFNDITKNKRYSALILEEHEKSDKLLSSILPPSLVKRVQQGETNISFAIQSVSIVFIDIVEFTPWCSSVPASTVMSTLNNLFRSFDDLIGQYPTMTKIKCIGDCYMAAGGVFSELNHPTTHAKEAVEFGLNAIDAVEEINKNMNLDLKIRIGINTGGPIIGGVLGIGKPTFEILGPAINLAQQMEHHGVPMNVHISRSVYELIYGNSFKIKERGTVETKGGNVITYLVLKN